MEHNAERSKRKITKTRRYISTDEETYNYKKPKKNKEDVLAAFDCIRKAMTENYEENGRLETNDNNSETGANGNSTDEEEQREISHDGHSYISEYTNLSRQKETEISELQFLPNQCDLSLSQPSNFTTTNSFETLTEPIAVVPIENSTNNDQLKQNDAIHQSHNILVRDQHSDNDIEMGTSQEELKHMIQAGFNAINETLRKQQQQLNEIQLHLKQNERSFSLPKKPQFFPMKSEECLDKFDNCSVEEYKNTIAYFVFLGGFNPKECVSAIIKESITDDFCVKLTWTGYANTIAIAHRRLTTAIYEALAKNNNFLKPQIPELQEAITEGLRNAKQRVRNKEKEKTQEKGKRRILVEKLQENLNILN